MTTRISRSRLVGNIIALLLTGPSKIAAYCSLRSLAATYGRALQQNASVRPWHAKSVHRRGASTAPVRDVWSKQIAPLVTDLVGVPRACLRRPGSLAKRPGVQVDCESPSWRILVVDRNAEVLAEQLLTWPTSDRARLAALLLASIEPSEADVEADVEAAWDEEVERRAADLDAGHVRGIPAADVFAEIDRRLRQ